MLEAVWIAVGLVILFSFAVHIVGWLRDVCRSGEKRPTSVTREQSFFGLRLFG